MSPTKMAFMGVFTPTPTFTSTTATPSAATEVATTYTPRPASMKTPLATARPRFWAGVAKLESLPVPTMHTFFVRVSR